MNSTYRNKLKKQHSSLAFLCLYRCWIDGADGIVLYREDLYSLLNIKRIEDTRINLLVEDFLELFPHHDYSRGFSGNTFFDMMNNEYGYIFESIRFSRKQTSEYKLTTFNKEDINKIRCSFYETEYSLHQDILLSAKHAINMLLS